MHKNPERIAWLALGTAFVVFCLLAIGIPMTGRSYLLNSTNAQDTQLQVIEGTVLLQKAGGSDPIGVTDAATLSPGDEVVTDDTSSATLDFFDRSHMTMYRKARVQLEKAQEPRFDLSSLPNQVALNVTGGTVRVGVALPEGRPTQFQVRTPHTDMALDEGSYRVEVSNEGTQVTVVRGQASVGGDQSPLQVQQGTRTWVGLSGTPTEPVPAAQNLVKNGNFEFPLSQNWITNTVVFTSAVKPPRVEAIENDGRRAVRLLRRELDDGTHSEVSIGQKLEQDVRDFSQLEVIADIFLDFQSLSGGGLLSSEFPIIVRLDYKDLWGSDKFWTRGFYYQNRDGYPIAPDPWGQPSGERIPKGVWYPYESGNLLELLGENRPAQITGLTLYASGWNYDGMVSEIQLIAE